MKLEKELWQVAMSPATLVCSPTKHPGERACTGVALITSNQKFSRPASDEAVLRLPEFWPFQNVKFNLNTDDDTIREFVQNTLPGTYNDALDNEGLYDSRNDSLESVLLGPTAWWAICSRHYEDPDAGSHFKEL